MPESVRPDVVDLGGVRCPQKFPPHTRVGIRESAELDWACEDPVLSFGEIGMLFPGLQSLERLACEIEGPSRAFCLHVTHNLLNDAAPDAES